MSRTFLTALLFLAPVQQVLCEESSVDSCVGEECVAGLDTEAQSLEVALLQRGLLDTRSHESNQSSQVPYAAAASCDHTPGWTNGYAQCATQEANAVYCKQQGWTCAGYLKNGWCKNGKLVANWAGGPSFNSPETNCCGCGGGALFETYKYTPADALTRPSSGAPVTFYVYRAVSEWESFYKLPNMNAASLGGVLWYLHNECIGTCDGKGFLASGSQWGERKFAVSRILRYKVTIKPTQPLIDMGMTFGLMCSYDSGECTGPHSYATEYGVGTGKLHAGDWNRIGFAVGCANLGDWPYTSFTTAKNYPTAVWYNFPAQCPIVNYKIATDDCKAAWPGGACDQPDGSGTCTHTYEFAGEINIDELVGITPKWKSRADFCTQCQKEGSSKGDGKGGCGFTWWENVQDPVKNKLRYDQAAKMFDEKYPEHPKTHEMVPPNCDFNRDVYGISAR